MIVYETAIYQMTVEFKLYKEPFVNKYKKTKSETFKKNLNFILLHCFVPHFLCWLKKCKTLQFMADTPTF